MVLASGTPVVLVSIDTLRADRLPSYGYAGVETPAIDALRADALQFQNAYTACPLTLPAHVSLMTGLLPPVHGVRDNIGYRLDPEAHPTLAQRLRQAGYSTGAAVSAYVLNRGTGLGAGFDRYDDAIEVTARTIGELQRSGRDTVAVARAWLGEQQDRAFFLFVHLFEPHTPYAPPEPYRSRYPSLYDGEIAAADAAVGELLAYLRERDLYDSALIVLLSDHGEGLGDHGEDEHGILLHRETLRVPLLVKLPGSRLAGRSVADPVQLADVVPTVLELLGLERPSELPGTSLLAIASAAPGSTPERRLYGETFYPRLHMAWSELRSLVDRRHHLIAGPRDELYDLHDDPAERVDVAGELPGIADAMRTDLHRLAGDFAAPATIDPKDAERLAALGYLATPVTSVGPLPDPKAGLPVLKRVRAAFERAGAGDHETAARLLAGIVAEQPGMLDARIQLAKSLTALGRLEDALEQYRLAAERAPAAADGLMVEAARLHLQLGRLEDAETQARAVLEPLPVEGHQLLAQVAAARGDIRGALAEAERAVSAEQLPRAESLLLLARLQLASAEHQAALATLDGLAGRVASGRLEPVPWLQFERGEALGRLERNADAAAAFREEIRFFPGHTRAYAHLCFVYAAMRRFDEIDPLLDAMVRADPRPETLLLAAGTAERLGDLEGAERWRLRARGTQPGSS